MLTEMWKNNVLGTSVERVQPEAWTKKEDFVLFSNFRVNPGFYPQPKVVRFLPVDISMTT